MTKEKRDIHAEITNRIIAALEGGVRPWNQPWANGNPGGIKGSMPLRVNGTPYKGINVVLLWMASMAKGHTSNMWMTFNQAKGLGGTVRKGEKGEMVVYASKFLKKDRDVKTGEETLKKIPFLKNYYVFNVAQIDGLPEKYYGKDEELPPVIEKRERITHLEAYFANCGADVRHGGDRAFFSPGGNFIQLPPIDAFKTTEAYYATKGHEFVHWTGHTNRLNRDFQRKGGNAYAAEELVAEMGSAFLCASLGLTPEIREDHAPYIAHWLKVLKDDKRFIFTAASAASKAVAYLDKLNGIETPVEEKVEMEQKEAA